MSVIPPAANGTTIWTGLLRYDCAAAGETSAAMNAARNTAPIVRITLIYVPPDP